MLGCVRGRYTKVCEARAQQGARREHIKEIFDRRATPLRVMHRTPAVPPFYATKL